MSSPAPMCSIICTTFGKSLPKSAASSNPVVLRCSSNLESGCQLLSLIMQLLIAKNDLASPETRINEDIVAGFRVFMHDIWRRKGVSKSQELLDAIDDKWVFTETQLRNAVTDTSLELMAIRQVYEPDGLVSQMVDHELRRRLHSLAMLPQWAQDLVTDLEHQFSRELISETLFSGAIQLRKLRPE